MDPNSAAVAPTNENPVDKFEEAFQNCLTAVTKEDTLTNVDRDEIKVDVEQCIQTFVEQARALEGYFLKKRLHIAAKKPELLIKDDSSELRFEINRKDDLIKKNFEKIAYWQSILADLQASANTTTASTSVPTTPTITNVPTPPGPGTPLSRPPTPGAVGRPQTPGSLGIQRMQSPGFPSPLSQQQSGLQGPLAFLEKTASGIGMNDNRP